MCGIAGCAVRGLQRDEVTARADLFIKALRHRGPDGDGSWYESGSVLLAHTRLAILDLSENGKQPMTSANGRYVLTFNGEIYNFRALRSQLEQYGVAFRGHSDTEVILELISSRGLESALELIEGMFAFAVYDRETGNLSLARDRMGEKPLFYGWVEGRFVFASELKAIQSLEAPLNLNRLAVADLLSFGYIPTPHTIYESIYKLVPGTYLTIKPNADIRASFDPYPNNGCGPRKYWDINALGSGQSSLSAEDTVRELRKSLEDTTARQLIADVPVGCFLSGGIDSSLVTAVAQSQSSTPIKTFTIGFESKQFNEAHYAKKIAQHLGTEHYETTVRSNDVLELVDSLPKVYDEPFADPSQLPSILVAREARKHVTVCLSGDGGDELFAGYNRYATASKALGSFSSVPRSFKAPLGKLLLALNPNSIDQALLKLSRLSKSRVFKQANLGLKLNKLGYLMRSTQVDEVYLFLLKLNGLSPDRRLPPTILERRVKDHFASSEDFISTAMMVDQINYLVDDNLTKVDRSAMSVSLETRLPLLDRQIVELSWRVAPAVKLREGTTKWPLREILYSYVPKELLERPKMGFSVPISEWLRNELKFWSLDLMANRELENLVDIRHYSNLLEKHQSGQRDYGLTLWPLLILSQWLQESSQNN